MEANFTYYRMTTRESLESAPAAKGDQGAIYDNAKARELLERYQDAATIYFCRPSDNDCRTRYIAEKGEIIYVKSTGGRFGRPARLIVGK
jgi:hypothetical protein